jgi:hypothetical protein
MAPDKSHEDLISSLRMPTRSLSISRGSVSKLRLDIVLSSIMQSSGYQNASDPIKKIILEKGMQKARAAATNILFGEKIQDPEFRAEYIRNKLKKKGIEE